MQNPNLFDLLEKENQGYKLNLVKKLINIHKLIKLKFLIIGFYVRFQFFKIFRS